jgi:tetratricopeptide (TPR) repeat protein
MADTAPLITEGKRHHQAGNLQAAEQMYRQVLAADPNHAEAMYFLGILHSQKGLFEQAADFLTKASTIDPRKPVYFYALANAYLELGEHDKAASRYRPALKLHPDFVEAHNNLGAALERSGRLAEAAAAYRRASALRPDFVSALVNLGNVHLKQEELDEAENCYRRAIQLAPDTAEAHNNLGNILQRRGDLDEAVRCFTAALDLSPSYIDAMNNLAGARKARYEVEESERLYVRALELAPGAAPVRLNFGTMLLDQNRTEEAVRQFELALEHDPALTEARWRRRLALPLLYDREEEIDQWRGRFSQGLDALIDETDTRDKAAVGEAARIIGATTNFYLNYQGRDDRELQRKFGAFVHELMAAVHPRWVKPRPMFKPGKDGRIRVGFISAHFRYHAATRMALNFIREGDRDSFKYFCYHTNTSHDDFTDLFRESADGWYENAHDVESMCKRITSDRPHVLIYTDVGMQGAITRLAALRLAPVQCMSWGHPVTSGSPAMD